MSDIDLRRWNVADMHVNESIAVSKIETDVYSKLKKVEYDKSIKFLERTNEVDSSVKGGIGSDDIANYQYNMIENPGPLTELADNPARNFNGGRYNVEVLAEDKTYYRGGNYGKPLGSGSQLNLLNQLQKKVI